MKTRNMRDLEKRWAEQRKKAAKPAKTNPKQNHKPNPGQTAPPEAKEPKAQ